MSRYIRSISEIPQWLIAGLLIYVPFHAFVSVWLASFIGHYTIVRLLPEFVLAIIAVWALIRISTRSTLRQKTIHTPLGKIILAYLGVIVVLSIVAYFRDTASPQAFWYGVLLTVRPVVWFAAVWMFATESQWLRDHWQKLVIVPLLVVAGFAIVQFFVLPGNFLSHFGYEKGITIAPIQTLNQDTETIRAQSTLRGPNPLGAYLAVAVTLLLVTALPVWRKIGISVVALLALLLSFSRSAWAGLAVSLVSLITFITSGTNRRRLLVALVTLGVIVGGVLFVFRDNHGVQNLVLHNSEQSTATETSNDAHATALSESISDITSEPLGRGPGTAGPASIYNNESEARNSESYFLNLGQEYGWVGLGVFVVVLALVGIRFYSARTLLGFAMLATLLGLIIINMLSYAWADTTMVYLWWGLAGITVAGATKPLALDVRLRRLFAPARQTYARIKPSRKGLRQFLYFNIGGAVFFGVGYVLFALLYGIAGWHWFAAKIIADLVGWTLNYLVQHYLAFQDTAKAQGHRSVLAKFIPFSLVNLVLDYGIVAGLAWLGVSPFIGLVVSSMFFTVWKWLGYKHWVFRLR